MGRFLPISNPQNRFESTSLEYDEGEAPRAELDIYEDQSKSILSANDSPDVGFRWSVNPYRGCVHACAYCLDGGTRILMADGTTRELRGLRVGDEIYGTSVVSSRRLYRRTRVLAHWRTVKPAFRVQLADGRELVASGDHRFLSDSGWRFVGADSTGPRSRLTTADRLLGTTRFDTKEDASVEYERGYLCGMVRADALRLPTFRREPEPRSVGGARRAPSTVIDLEGFRRAQRFLENASVDTRELLFFKQASGEGGGSGIGQSRAAANEARVRTIVEWPLAPSRAWRRGFLAGMFDAEGTYGRGTLRIAADKSLVDPALFDATVAACRALGFEAIVDHEAGPGSVRILGGFEEHLRFAHVTDPAIRRKWNFDGIAVDVSPKLAVTSVEPLGVDLVMFDITTGTGDFIADGVVSHNCYARPSHEYLSFGAGTDFERKIVVKPRAAELLRGSFDKPSWKGERVVFSGITDCYQPVERKLELTRRCMEVCVEYRNPVGVITKSPVIERDIDVLQELTRVANARVSVSVPFWDPDVARAMEPGVTTPERRLRIVETLAKAGIRVGVSVSPIVPGLNDEHLGDVLARAADAGAKHAFYVLLRLPGPVAVVFEEALRAKLPLRAEKVLRRLREAHDGKLYDATFGKRGRGEGVYAEAIRVLFERTAKRFGLADDEMRPEDVEASAPTFRRPNKNGQITFGF